MDMSILTPITRLAMIGGSAGIIAVTAAGLWPGGSTANVEQGYVNPNNVELYTPKNDNGNLELYLQFDDGEINRDFPIMKGPNGPIVGSANYQWDNMDAETQSGLVERTWNKLNIETRLGILRSDIEQMLETYKGE
jgi:hypothetical protein